MRTFRSPIARLIVNVLRENHGEIYAEEKADRLEVLDTAQVLLWCANLDSKNLADVAEALGVSVSSLQTTVSTLRQIIG